MTKRSGNKTAPMEDKPLEDYQSPPGILEALMRAEALPEIIWEPAAGQGNLVQVLIDSGRHVRADDINAAYSAIHGRMPQDFLLTLQPPVFQGTPAQAIVTNPPFSLMARFADHGLALCKDVYLFGRLNFMEGGQRDALRDRILSKRAGLRHVYVLRERPQGMHRTNWDGPKASTSMTFSWFCWRRGWTGKTGISRISLKSDAPLLPPPVPKNKALKWRCKDTIEMFREGGVDVD